MGLFFQIMQLLFGVVHAVHEVQVSMGAGNGAAKSQAVIDKVTPIANAIGANQEMIQSVINQAVVVAKATGAAGFVSAKKAGKVVEFDHQPYLDAMPKPPVDEAGAGG